MAKKKAKKTTNEPEVVDPETLKGESTKPTVTPIKPTEKTKEKVNEEEEEETVPTATSVEDSDELADSKRVYVIDDEGKVVELVNEQGKALNMKYNGAPTKVWKLIKDIRERRDSKTPTPQDSVTYTYLKTLGLEGVIDNPLDKAGFNTLLKAKGFNEPTADAKTRRTTQWQEYHRKFTRSDPKKSTLVGTYTYVEPATAVPSDEAPPVTEPFEPPLDPDASFPIPLPEKRSESPSVVRDPMQVLTSSSDVKGVILNDKQRLDAIKSANEGKEGEPFVAVSETGTVVTSEEPAYKRIANQSVNIIVQDSTKVSELTPSLIEKVKNYIPTTSETTKYKDYLLTRLEDKINPPVTVSSNPIVEALELLEEAQAEELVGQTTEELRTEADDEVIPTTTLVAASITGAEGDLPAAEDDPMITTTPYEPPSDVGSPIAITNINVKRYHPKSLLFFFGSKDIPDWDSELRKEVMKSEYEKGELALYMDTIVKEYGNKIFVYKRKSDTKEEFNELIQLQFCVMRNLNRGDRFRTATVIVDELEKVKQGSKSSQAGPRIVAPGLVPPPGGSSTSGSMGPVTTVNRPTGSTSYGGSARGGTTFGGAASGSKMTVKEAEKNFQNVVNTSKVNFDGRRIEPTKPIPVKKDQDPLSTLTSNRPLMTPSQVGAPKLKIKRKQ